MQHPHPRDRQRPSRLTTYRSRQRARSHDELHDGDHVAAAVLEHALVPAGEPVLVTDQRRTDELVERWRELGRFAFDTEFIGEETYYPQLCLVQVATPDAVVLLDPMAGLNLREFWSLVADASVEKIVHAGLQDLEPVVRHLDQPPRNVFDTQLAAGFAGLTYPMSLDKLVHALAGVDPARGAKFSQWANRPLSPVQLGYAANDVRYLLLLRDELGERLEARGNTAWAQARCDELSDRSLYEFDAQSQRLRVRGLEWMSARQRAVLRTLTRWRDEAARAHDVPPRALLRDELLVELSRTPRRSLQELAAVRGLPRPVQRQHGATLLTLTAEAMTRPLTPEDAPPVAPRRRPDPAAVEAWQAVETRCRDAGIDPAAVTSKRDFMTHWEAKRIGRASPLPRLIDGWRRDLLGHLLDLPPHAQIRGEPEPA